MSATSGRAYPVAGDDDSRFTFGLLHDVTRVLEAHGYPPVVAGPDLEQLYLALFRFLHGSSGRG